MAGKNLFKKGQSGNPKGRPKGSVSDKTKMLNIIFKIAEEVGDKFEVKMRALAKKDPISFYRKFVEPIQPKDFSIKHERGEGGPMRIIVETVEMMKEQPQNE